MSEVLTSPAAYLTLCVFTFIWHLKLCEISHKYLLSKTILIPCCNLQMLYDIKANDSSTVISLNRGWLYYTSVAPFFIV